MKTTWRETLYDLLAAASAAKILCGAIGFSRLGLPAGRVLAAFAVMVTFALVAVVVLAGPERDERARFLGRLYLLIAASFSRNLAVGVIRADMQPVATIVSVITSVQVEAFMPWVLWSFFCRFPRVRQSGQVQFEKRGEILLFVLSVSLFLINAGAAFAQLADISFPLILQSLVRRTDARFSYFWTLVLALCLQGVALVVVRWSRAVADERRRLSAFVWGIAMGFAPMLTAVIATRLIPPVRHFMDQPRWQNPVIAIGFVGLLSVPLTTMYAVTVQHVIDVRLIIRRAVRYAFARSTMTVATAIPFVLLLVYLLQNRDKTLGDLFNSRSATVFIPLFVFTLILYAVRPRILETIDRSFFRERYDSGSVLAHLIHECREIRRVEELAPVLVRELDSALHLDSIVFFQRAADQSGFVAMNSRYPPLPARSALAGSLEISDKGIDVAAEANRLRLSQADQDWLLPGAFQLLVPVLSTEGKLIGIIAIGRRRGDLPISETDRALLVSASNSVALALETVTRQQTSDSEPLPSESPALRCGVCSTIQPSTTGEHCTVCGSRTIQIDLPPTLLRKFQLRRLLGAGGMGVVYEAMDLELGRTVAVKTLPKLSPPAATRLRREARAMASFTHPNVATIFEIATWRNIPIMVLEYLPNGTLADLLKKEGADPRRIFTVGLEIATVLTVAHRSGILHRDIKPSNIGIAADGTIKLLDFGLVKLLDEALATEGSGRGSASKLTTGPGTAQHLTDSGVLIGTPLYMSPEVLAGHPATSSLDLWALSIVIYEGLAGRHPLASLPLREVIRTIQKGRMPAIETIAPATPEAAIRFCESNLALDPRKRASSADELRVQIQQVLSAIG